MTPSSAASQIAQAPGIGLGPRGSATDDEQNALAMFVDAPLATLVDIGISAPSQAERKLLAKLLDTRTWSTVRLVVDVVVLYLAAGAALLASTAGRSVPSDRWLAAIFPLIVLAILSFRTDRHERLDGSLLDAAAVVVGVVSLAAMMTIALDSILGGRQAIGLAVQLWLFSLVYLGAARLGLLSFRQRLRSTPALATPTLVIGAGAVGEHVVKRLVGNRGYGLNPVGFLDSNPLPSANGSGSPTVPVLGGLDDLTTVLKETGARQVILAFTSEPDQCLVEKVRECRELGVEVALVPRLYESVSARSSLDHVGGLPLLTLRAVDPRGWQFVIKHAIDRTAAAAALVALAPLMILIATVIRLGSPGPILFRQRRVGRDGQDFDLLKFRTMRERAHGDQEFNLPEGVAPGGVEGVDRRTRIGRWLRGSALDELPQFINVLRGDMSLVGPRPERPEFVELFAERYDRYDDRHRVKSGITGWAQVNGLRGQTSIADRVEWDNYYIENWSIWLDLRILALTAAEILRFRED